MLINLVTRQSVFDANPVLARALYDWQQATFDPLGERYHAGQTVWDSNMDCLSVLTEESADALNAEAEVYRIEKTDPFDPVPPHLPNGTFCIAEFLSTSFEAFVSSVAIPTEALFDRLGWDHIMMAGFTRSPFLDGCNNAAMVVAAKERLQAAGLALDYSGAISASPEHAAKFLAEYFWIARCNASAPYLYVSAPNASTLLVPCKYGNYHVETYAAAEAAAIKTALRDAGFTLAADGVCEERYSKSGKIPARKLQI